MQEAPGELAAALDRGSVIWVPQIVTDWARDGYDGDGTIDDLSELAGTISVVQSMDDGYPDEVSLLNNSGIPSAGARLGGGRAAVGGRILTAVQYWSPYSAASPLFGFDRDIQDLVVLQGAVADSGLEQIQLFGGVLSDTPVASDKASLEAGSRTRRTLSFPVMPFQAWRRYSTSQYGLTATWPIIWALYECGVNAAPPPQDGVVNWYPLHGGGFGYYSTKDPIADDNLPFIGRRRRSTDTSSAVGPTEDVQPLWTRGPYVGAAYNYIRDDEIRFIIGGTFPWAIDEFENEQRGDNDCWSETDQTGRVEYWVRGDDYDASTSPGGLDAYNWFPSNVNREFMSGFAVLNNVTDSYVCGGINEDRELFIQVSDTVTTTVAFGPTLPNDDAWHFVGFAWDGTGGSGTMWMTLDNVTVSAAFTITVANLPTTQTPASDICYHIHCLPVSDLQVTMGDLGNPSTGNPWLNQVDWDRGAFVYPSSLDLEVVAEEEPVEAWQLIARYALAEVAAMSIDESDIFHYRPQGYFATVAGSAVQQILTADFHTATPDVKLDSSRIRTAVRVSFDQTSIDTDSTDFLYDARTVLIIPPGRSTLTVALRTGGVAPGRPLQHMTSNQRAGTATILGVGSLIAMNSTETGSGTYASDNEIEVTISAWTAGQVDVAFHNKTSFIWYVVHNGSNSVPFIAITGWPVRSDSASVVEFDEDAVALRGYRLLVVRSEAIHSESEARHVGRRLLGLLRRPQSIVGSLEAFGDPRRQVGDVVTLQDTYETGLSANIKIHSIRHNIDGAAYTQTLTGREVIPVGVWGQGHWGQCVWAGLEAE